MKKSVATDVRSLVARKHLEVFRQENRQYERLLKLLNSVGTVADRIRQALDEADRGLSVGLEIRKAREIIEAELGRVSKSGDEGHTSRAPARYETNVAALQACNAKLLEAIQQRARENQLLVCRALAMTQGIINTVGASKPALSDSGSNQSSGMSAAA